MRCYLGIDIGTYESKGVLVDGEGHVAATARRSHRMLVPQPGWAEHRAEEDWWADFTAIAHELVESSGVSAVDIRAVGASAIGPCMLPVDSAGAPLMNAVLYGVDTRADREIADLTEQIGADLLIGRCGNALTSQSLGPKILWLRHNCPEIFARTAMIAGATSYLVHKLTGRWVIDHYSAANTTPLYLVDEQAYGDALAEDIIDLERLPEPVWTTDIAGGLTAEAAAATGLAEGTPVIAGTIDAAAEAVSVGVRAPGDMLMMYGSTMFMIGLTAERVRDGRLWYGPWLFPGGHAAIAGLATSGTLTHWFREQFARELDPAKAVAVLAAEAESSPPGAKGLVLLPYFSGERTPIHDPRAKGVIFGLDLTHSRADLCRALLEGIAYGTRHVLETYAELGADPRTIMAAGGGTNNAVWAEAVSDVCGRKQIVREVTIGASYGDAFLAALGVGDARPDDIDHWNPVVREIAPHPARVAVYGKLYSIFRELYPRTRDLMAAVSEG